MRVTLVCEWCVLILVVEVAGTVGCELLVM